MTTIPKEYGAEPWEDNGFTEAVRSYVKLRETTGGKPDVLDLHMLRLALLELEARDEALA